MSDPLSVASGLAGLICLGSTAGKLFYSFFISTVGAPSSARSLGVGFVFIENLALPSSRGIARPKLHTAIQRPRDCRA